MRHETHILNLLFRRAKEQGTVTVSELRRLGAPALAAFRKMQEGGLVYLTGERLSLTMMGFACAVAVSGRRPMRAASVTPFPKPRSLARAA